MAKIISIEERRLSKAMQGEVSSSRAQIAELTRKLYLNNGSVLPYRNLNDWMRETISKEIMRRKEMSEELFLCGVYIASMLARLDCDLEKYAVDFLEKFSTSSDPEFLKMGGDFCFVLCGGFRARCDRRMMSVQDYQNLGASFYDWFYSSTGKVIGHYMSQNFELMQEVVGSVLTPAAGGARGI